MKKYSLTIGWLYPELMSTYGDRGNIIVLQRRCQLRGIEIEVLPIDENTTAKDLEAVNLLFGGGSQDKEQEIVMNDLHKGKGKKIKSLIENAVPALFVCGSPQLMGLYYEPAVGKRLEGLGIFDMVSLHPGLDVPRCIGNIVAEVQWNHLPNMMNQNLTTSLIVGFENHGGRTYLGSNAKPFAKVIKGFGNNGEDQTEGAVYNNAIGCYFHGPLLPKNPVIADFLIQRSLEVKYEELIKLEKLDDDLETQARNTMLKRLSIPQSN